MIRIIAALSCILGVLLMVVVLPEGLRIISPLLLWPMVYGWVLFFPLALPLPVLFIIALCNDILMGTPLGVMPLATLFLAWLAHKEVRVVRRNFATLWFHFTLYSLAAILLMVITLSLYQWRLVALQPVLMQWLLTVFCYPPIHGVLLHGLRAYKIGES